MQPEDQQAQFPTYKFLVIGRMGDGKSSLCKFLTGLQSIEVSSKVVSCTHQCKLYSSSDKINQQRGYAVEVLDTPGLDSKEENMLNIVMQLADIFTKSESINGILYAVSMGQSRDETISWFLNFLRLYFTKDQLATSIIPILTHYDKVIFQDDEKVMEMKNSRKEAIHRIWGQGQNQEQVINFWQNHIQWINDANQKAGLRQNLDFKSIYYSQLGRLMEKARSIKLELGQNARNFEANLIDKITTKIKKSKKQYKQQSQEVPPIKFKVHLEKLSFWKTLKELNTLSKIIIGSFVVLGAKGYASKKYKKYERSMEKIDGLFEEVKNGISKIIHAKFLVQFSDWITITTSKSNTIQDLNRVFSVGGLCQFHITLPEDTIFGIQTLQLARISPESKEPVVMLNKTENNKITFQDSRRFTQQNERVYEFRNIKILRPEDNFLNEILTQIVQSK